MLRQAFGRKKAVPQGWQVGDPPEAGKGLEQPLPRVSSRPVRHRPGINQVEEVRQAIEDVIATSGYCALAMPERVFINMYFGLSAYVAGPDTAWRIVSPRDWVTAIIGLEQMGETVVVGFIHEVLRYKSQDIRNADGETDHFDGLREIMMRWSKVKFDRADVLQRYLERDYWGSLVR